MKTLHRTIAGAALAAGMALAPAPTASAVDPEYPGDPYGFHDYRDRTDYLVTPFQAGALIGDKTNRPIIISPYGTSQKIECRGDGHYVQIQACRQYDTNNVAHVLQYANIFGRQVYFYN